VHLTPEQVVANRDQIPTDRDVVLFCNYPREAAAAQVTVRLREFGFARVYPLEGGLVTVRLREFGFARVYPLEGGLDGWERAGFPLEVRPRG
jgi:rhodanese-related sulfurtransferase